VSKKLKSNQLCTKINGLIYVADLIKILKSQDALLKAIGKEINPKENIEWLVVDVKFKKIDDKYSLAITIEGVPKRKKQPKKEKEKHELSNNQTINGQQG